MTLQCSPGEELSQGICYPKCTPGSTGHGPLCLKVCPVGFIDVGTACAKPTMSRPNGSMPSLSSCAPGMRDDGNHCWADQKCSYVRNEMNQTVLSCSGCGCIRQTKTERQSCGSGYELVNGLCYPKCYNGYTSVGTKCVANCPNGFTDLGTNCTKPSTARNAGSMHTNGLKRITDDPRKSTLALRSQLADSQINETKNRSFTSILGNTDYFTATYANVVSSSATISSVVKKLQDSSGAFYWVILIVGSLVVLSAIPGGSFLISGIGSAIPYIAGAFKSAVSGAATVAVNASKAVTDVVEDVGAVATKTVESAESIITPALQGLSEVVSQTATTASNAIQNTST